MIRADYSGLNWKKLGWPVPMTHARCGGQIMYSPTYKSLFCSSCGKWIYLGKNKKPQSTDNKPATALQALLSANHE